MNQTKHIGHRLRILNQMIMQTMDRKFNTLDLTASQSFILQYLTANQDQVVYAKDIEKRFQLSHPTVSGILQRMQSKGFLTIDADPDDRRHKRILPTQKALQCQKEVCHDLVQLEHVMTQNMNDDEIQTLFRLLDQAVQNLHESFDKEDKHI